MRRMSCRNMRELITGSVDNQISAEERSVLRRHLAECRACDTALSLERRIKAASSAAGARVEVPAELQLLLERQYGARNDPLWARAREYWQIAHRPLPAAVLLLLMLGSLAFLLLDARHPVSVAALEMHRSVAAGSVGYTQAESPKVLAQELSRGVGGRFMPPVFDLGRLGFHAAGGFHEKVLDRDVLVTIYEGRGGMVTCHIFLGDESDIPEGAQLIDEPLDGRRYFVFSDGEINGVLQQNGSEICVLASRLPMDELMRIARSLQTANRG